MNLPIRYAPVQMPLPSEPDTALPDEDRDFVASIRFLRDRLPLIAGITIFFTIVGGMYALLAPPVYEANLLIRVQDTASTQPGAPGELPYFLETKTAVASEMEILRSRQVLGRVIESARLYIEVKPKYLPLLGEWLAQNMPQFWSPGIFGMGGYVWGTERAEIATFNVPEQLEGKRFTITAAEPGRFRLTQAEHEIDISGRVGTASRAVTPQGEIEILVTELAAQAGSEFTVTRLSKGEAAEKLLKQMHVSEKGRQSAIIGVALRGTEPQRTADVLNAIAHEYIRHNADRKAENTDSSLVFLRTQLPKLKDEVERSEFEYNRLRRNHEVLDLGEESKVLVQRAAAAQAKLVDLRQKRQELLGRYQEAHPAVEAIDNQIAEINREQARIATKVKAMPAIEQDLMRVMRDLKVNTELYTSMLAAASQLQLAESARVPNVHLLDAAIKPAKPVKPQRALIVVLAMLGGLTLALITALMRRAVSEKIDNPQNIERLVGVPVHVTIPYSKNQERLHARLEDETKEKVLLPYDTPFDGAVESLRTLRTLLQSVMADAPNNIVVITGPTSGVGKSFVSANLATVLGSTGKRVLLIDGDMRTGYLHHYFGVSRGQGLSELIADQTAPDRTVHRRVVDNVDFISTGSLPPNPAELLEHSNFGKLLEILKACYDIILIDTPPVLGLADALVVSAHAGAVFNIVRGGVTTPAEIEESVRLLNQTSRGVTGVVYNDAKTGFGRYGYGNHYSRYGHA